MLRVAVDGTRYMVLLSRIAWEQRLRIITVCSCGKLIQILAAMGKHPGKWLKTILFGKKSSRSQPSEKLTKRDSGRENAKKASKDKDTQILENESMQDQVPNAILGSDPSSMGREIEQHIPLRDRSKKAVFAGTEKFFFVYIDW